MVFHKTALLISSVLLMCLLCSCQTSTIPSSKPLATTKTVHATKKVIPAVQTKNIKLHDVTDDVKQVQQYLATLKYPVIVDGKFGTATEFYVKELQFKAKLPQTGVVDDATYKVLSAPNQSQSLSFTGTSTPSNIDYSSVQSKVNYLNSQDAYSQTGFYIWVNLANKQVNIFQGNDKTWQLTNTFQCDCGKPGTPTATGHFEMGMKMPVLKTGSNQEVKWVSQISSNYLFHSILLSGNGQPQDSELGASISHGCVRLSIDNAKYIYDNIPSTTEIFIN
jgi:lipoprotein-anchoring transpeptidase ErfK/SrfK